MPNTPDDEKRINTIRALSIDAVQKANSGHPGMPLGAAADGLRVCDAPPALQPEGPAVVQPRPLRAQRRPRVDAALLAALPDRLRPDPRRPQELPPVGQQDAGPPRAAPHAGRRGDDRAAGPGLRQRGRPGDGRGAPRRDLQPAATPDRRPLHLRDVRRRRPDGRRRLGGGLARRPPRARQADRALRRQQGLARRPDRRSRSPRTSARASTPTAGTCRTSTIDAANDVDAIDAAIDMAKNVTDRPVDHPGAHAHRLRVAARRTRIRRARRAARRRERHQDERGARAGRPSRRSSCPTTCSRVGASAASAARKPKRLERRLRRLEERQSGAGRAVRARAATASCRSRLAVAGIHRRERQRRHARRGRHRDERDRRRAARTRRRFGRPRPVDQDLPQGSAATSRPGTYDGRNVHFGVREHAMARGHERHRRSRRAAAVHARPSSTSSTT